MTGSIPAIVMASEDAGLLVREGSISARMTETGFVSAYPRRSSDQAPRPMSDVFAKLTWRFCGAPDWKSPMDASSRREAGTTPSPAASATDLIMPTRSWTAYGSAAPSATNLDRNTSRLFVRFAWNAMAWRSEVNAATTGASDPNSPASTWAYVSNRPVREALTAAGALPPRRDSRSCTAVNAASSRSAAARSSDAGRPAHLANCAVMASDESVPGRCLISRIMYCTEPSTSRRVTSRTGVEGADEPISWASWRRALSFLIWARYARNAAARAHGAGASPSDRRNAAMYRRTVSLLGFSATWPDASAMPGASMSSM